MIRKDRTVGHIGAVTGDRGIAQRGILIHIGVSRCDSVIEYPGAVGRVGFQITFTLHKAAQIPRFHLVANIPQRTDAAEEGIFFVGNVSDLIFQIARFYQLLLYAAFSKRDFWASSMRKRASISENVSVRLNFSDTFPGMACSFSIRLHNSGW